MARAAWVGSVSGGQDAECACLELCEERGEPTGPDRRGDLEHNGAKGFSSVAKAWGRLKSVPKLRPDPMPSGSREQSSRIPKNAFHLILIPIPKQPPLLMEAEPFPLKNFSSEKSRATAALDSGVDPAWELLVWPQSLGVSDKENT